MTNRITTGIAIIALIIVSATLWLWWTPLARVIAPLIYNEKPQIASATLARSEIGAHETTRLTIRVTDDHLHADTPESLARGRAAAKVSFANRLASAALEHVSVSEGVVQYTFSIAARHTSGADEVTFEYSDSKHTATEKLPLSIVALPPTIWGIGLPKKLIVGHTAHLAASVTHMEDTVDALSATIDIDPDLFEVRSMQRKEVDEKSVRFIFEAVPRVAVTAVPVTVIVEGTTGRTDSTYDLDVVENAKPSMRVALPDSLELGGGTSKTLTVDVRDDHLDLLESRAALRELFSVRAENGLLKAVVRQATRTAQGVRYEIGIRSDRVVDSIYTHTKP